MTSNYMVGPRGRARRGDPIAPCRSASTHLCQTRATFTCTRRWTAAIETIPSRRDAEVRYRVGGERVDATNAGNTPTPYDKGYTGRQTRNYNGRQTGWRNPKTGQLYGGKSWSDNTRDTQKGFGYTVNRDRCVLKDGVYWGEGNRELQPTATWWRCGQKTRKTSRWTAGEEVWGRTSSPRIDTRASPPPSRGPCPSTASSREDAPCAPIRRRITARTIREGRDTDRGRKIRTARRVGPGRRGVSIDNPWTDRLRGSSRVGFEALREASRRASTRRVAPASGVSDRLAV